MLAQRYREIVQKVKTVNEDCTVIAVSKYQPCEKLLEAYEAGCRDFGENKVQELVEKYDLLPKDIRWHMIGHLQTNKIKYIVDKVTLIHGVDSLKLAREIQKECLKRDLTVDILLEVNVAREESKYGFSIDEAREAAREISGYSHVFVKGLMTIAPATPDSDANRKFFKQLKQLSVDIMQERLDNISMDILSMGMSGDYVSAVDEGATHVRVGTSIFGDRS